VEKLRDNNDYEVMDVRGDLQALNINALRSELEKRDVFFEGNTYIADFIYRSYSLNEVRKLGIFLSPLSREEILYLKSPEKHGALRDFVADVMRRKLLRRTSRFKNGLLSLKELEMIERRAVSAYEELQMACRFNIVIPNHDGEDSENWDAFYYPIGDARQALLDFVNLLENKNTCIAENWERNLLPAD